ncbi:MAG: MIP/aquaporin family protein [Pseudomonadota bacterium]
MTDAAETPPSFILAQRLAAEALGTAVLLATVVGSGIMGEALAGGNVAIALLGNTIATGAILVVLILGLGPLSGAHFNPAVTFFFWLRRELPGRDALLYVLVQIIGALAGMIIAHLMFALDPLQVSQNVRAGPSQWLSEGVATLSLLMAIICTLKWRPEAVPMAVGLAITAGYWFTASTSFANPAVTIARSFSDTFSGIAPADAPAFIVAQFLAALVAWRLFGWLLRPSDS